MIGRSALIAAAVIAATAVVLSACGPAPDVSGAPALTDPKEILSKSILSLKDVTTVEVSGNLTGTLEFSGLNDIDLSDGTMSAGLDIPAGKAKVLLEIPGLIDVDAIVAGGSAYYRLSGALALMFGGSGDKYTETAIPESSDGPVTDPAGMARQLDDLLAQLDGLPAPTRAANERCGDADCYHVRLEPSAEDLAEIDPGADAVDDASLSLDLWSRTNDLRPARLDVSSASAAIGATGMTLEFEDDRPVDIEAPPADEVAE